MSLNHAVIRQTDNLEEAQYPLGEASGSDVHAVIPMRGYIALDPTNLPKQWTNGKYGSGSMTTGQLDLDKLKEKCSMYVSPYEHGLFMPPHLRNIRFKPVCASKLKKCTANFRFSSSLPARFTGKSVTLIDLCFCRCYLNYKERPFSSF